MNNLNMPLYRGFSKTFNKYILGIPYFSDGRYYMLVDDCNKNNDIGTGSFPIDETTLAIHFPDMLDSEGNKIFASLSKDGKGGDICEINISDAFLEKNYNIKCPLLMTRKGIAPKEYIGFANFKIINVIGLEK